MSEVIKAELVRVAEQLGHPGVTFVLERPRDAGHGDLATNLAMVLAKLDKAKPRQIAERVLVDLKLPSSLVSKVEIAGPGFINFWLAEGQLALVVRQILERGPAYGRSEFGVGLKVNVEFVSANPTGPLHVGHGRGAAYGDALASLLQWTGHSLTREFYINDAGLQIDKLALSLWARIQHALGREAEIPEGGYHGLYLVEAAERVLRERGRDFADLPAEEGIRQCRALAVRMQREEQDRDMADFGVHFDVFTSEQSLYERGLVDGALVLLGEKGLTYEEGGALWLRTTQFGDDKDRVLRKSDASLTYLVPDIAYHVDKRNRGFDRAIDVWGADHHGHVARVKAALRALGLDPELLTVALVQFAVLYRDGNKASMSTRSGEFVTLRELRSEVGNDAARFFYVLRKRDQHLDFDLDLAKSQSNDNPVYYVQYAHARICSVLEQWGEDESSLRNADLGALTSDQELQILRLLMDYPAVVEDAARDLAPHLVAFYLKDLAAVFHSYYNSTHFLVDDELARMARLSLIVAVRHVLASGLGLLGVSAPAKM